MSDAHQLAPEDQLNEARWLMEDHTPANQDGNPYERCDRCEYTRHPCDIYDLASWLIVALERNNDG